MAIVAVAALVGACGGSKATENDATKAGGQSDASTTTAVEGGAAGGGTEAKSATPTTQKASGGGTANSSGASPSNAEGGTQGGTETAEKPKQPLPIEVSLKSNCVKAGGQQSITFRTVPGSGVGYDSTYSDGKSGMQEGFYGGNNGKSFPSEPADEDATWTDTWTIAAHAPPGKVKVTVLAGHMEFSPIERTLFFDLVPATGTCP